MAATRFWAPLLLVFFTTTIKLKWSKSDGHHDMEPPGPLEFVFCVPLAPEITANLGTEVLHHMCRAHNRDGNYRICSSSPPSLFYTLLLLGGDVELNPGDWKFPCGICSKPVKSNQAGIQCDQCNTWFHTNSKCCEISPEIYTILANSSCSWICPQCGLPNFSDSYFNDSIGSLNSSNYFEPLSEFEPQASQASSPIHCQLPSRKKKQKQFKRNKMTCLVINCRSIRNKVADVAAVIDEHKPDIILGNESWLNPDIASGEIFPNNYNVFRKDRISDCQGGGVFQAARKDIIITHRTDLDTDCEIIWTQCQLASKKSKSIFFGSYYRPHTSDMKSLDELDASILKMGEKLHKSNVIIAGDFNAPNIDWENHEVLGNSTTSERLLEIIDEHDLNQLVKEPTRRQGETQNILDLVLSNNKNIVDSVAVTPGISDHDIVLFTVKTSCQKKRNVKRKVYIRKKADSDRIKEELNTLADQIGTLHSTTESVEVKWNTFEENIRRIMNTHIPHKMTSTRYDLPWFSRPLRRQARAKQRLYNRANKSGNPIHWAKFHAARKRMHTSLKLARERYTSDYLGKAIEENPKRFWSFIKQLKQEDPGVADFEVDGNIISDGRSKSEILNKIFSNAFTDENLANIPDVGKDPKPSISSITVTVSGVTKQLTSLKPNKACGPDDIPPWFLKEYAQEIAPMLTNIYQDSIDTGIVPCRWKTANVCGIFKKGEKSDPTNYRPISLTCIASKILEHIIHSHVMKHLEQYNILTDCQHGFRSKRSTETQLILTIHDIANAVQRGQSVHAAVLDFSKAFDKVPHKRLLKKLQYYGIHANLLTWFESFLTQRFQTVICEGKSSCPSPVTSGVPQGTVLGPLLFLLYINDLPDDLQSPVKLFADDALLYGVITNDTDCDRLQEDLHKLEQWQHRWQMEFNPSKCKILCISTKKDPPQKKYVFCGVELENVDSIAYLGIIINSKLKWDQHISSVSTKASRVLGMIRRNLWNCPKTVRETAYKAIVEPKLEYASAAWDPHYEKDKAALSRIQRKAARFCTNNYKQTASVTDMLADLGWESLQTRRKKARLTLMYKLTHNLVNINTDKHLALHTETRTRGSHSFKYRVPTTTKDVFKFSFFPRTINEWNSLPERIVTSASLDVFKTNLSNYF